MFFLFKLLPSLSKGCRPPIQRLRDREFSPRSDIDNGRQKKIKIFFTPHSVEAKKKKYAATATRSPARFTFSVYRFTLFGHRALSLSSQAHFFSKGNKKSCRAFGGWYESRQRCQCDQFELLVRQLEAKKDKVKNKNVWGKFAHPIRSVGLSSAGNWLYTNLT